MKCQHGHIYDQKEFNECPSCEHLQAEWNDLVHEESIDAGDEEHMIIVPINEKTTADKGADIL